MSTEEKQNGSKWGWVPGGSDRKAFARYLAVGLANTAFAYGCYAALTAVFMHFNQYGYVGASVAGYPISVTFAFLGYKWFVFRTKGNYLREWVRCMGVYSGAAIFNVLALPVVVTLIRHTTPYHRGAPYLAGALLTGVTVIISYFGHKHISFRPGREEAELRNSP